MLLYNSMTRKKEKFLPLTPGRAGIYVCGITSYDYCHIGHARSAIVFDMLCRQLRHIGLDVFFIRNFTDIDDKIINRARQGDGDWQAISEKFIAAFHEDMARLNVLPPTLEPRATQHIQQIISLCSELVEKGMAYATAGGDVYFSVRDYAPYGRLSGRSLDELKAGARVLPGEQKRDPLDFAIWKSAKPGEPSWPSPWGEGRPGWHIECSAMSLPFLPLDIHGGGQDLLFPHHENEIAQSEAVCSCQLARFWVHNGFVRINSEKMSKSLGNFFTIREVLRQFLPETLRFFLLGKHYRSPIDFSFEGMEEAEKAQERVYRCILDARARLDSLPIAGLDCCLEPGNGADELKRAFDAAMDDVLNSAQALGHIFARVHEARKIIDDKKAAKNRHARSMLEAFLARAAEWSARLGIFGQDPARFLDELKKMRISRKNIDLERVHSLLEERAAARKARDFARSDALRDELLSLGIGVKDNPGGTDWDVI